MKKETTEKILVQAIQKNISLLLAGMILILVSIAACMHDISGYRIDIFTTLIKLPLVYLPASMLIILTDYFILKQATKKEDEKVFLEKAFRTKNRIIWIAVFACFVLMVVTF